eukprot:GDKI01028000.1.p1 GENE.GDKI01028000.1~~GDKI01028000.1.p1  ORF type:complete len:372 (+),score=112.62 GDKI01028000.1:180-1295(+)
MTAQGTQSDVHVHANGVYVHIGTGETQPLSSLGGLTPSFDRTQHVQTWSLCALVVKEEHLGRFLHVKLLQQAPSNEGRVDLYFDVQQQRLCAVKEVPKSLVSRNEELGSNEQPFADQAVCKYMMECETAAVEQTAGVTRRHTVDWYGAFENDTHYFYVYEYLPHGDLFTHIAQRVRVTELVIREYAKQILECVLALHSRGITHQDISVENVMLHQDGTLRLIDFGHAQLLRYTGDATIPTVPITGQRGKKTCRAPETYFGSYQGTPVDIYAVATTLLVLLITPVFQKYPFEVHHHSCTRYRYFREFGLSRFLSRFNIQMSNEFIDLVSRMLHKNPAHRPTAEQCLRHPWIAGAHTHTQPAVVAQTSDNIPV